MTLTINDFQNSNWYFFSEASIFNNRHLEIVASSPENKNPNISASFFIIARFLFVFCSWIPSSSSLGTSFLLGGTYVSEKFLDNSSTSLNLYFWKRLKGRPSEIIRYAIVIVRRLVLGVIIFWELPPIPKTNQPFEKLLELLSYVIFDAEVKPGITD